MGSEGGLPEEGHASGGAAGLPSRPARLVAFGCHLLLGLEGLGVLQGPPAAGEDSREGRVDGARCASVEEVISLIIGGRRQGGWCKVRERR